MAHLSLADSEQRLLFAKVDLNAPAVKIALQHRGDRQIGIGADEERRLAVKQLGAFSQPVAKRGNHHQSQDPAVRHNRGPSDLTRNWRSAPPAEASIRLQGTVSSVRS